MGLEKSKSTFILLLVLSFVSHAEDNVKCSVGKPTALLKKEKYQSHKFSTERNNAATESADLGNGMTVAIHTAGCVDGREYSIVFDIKNPAKPIKEFVYWIGFAITQLKELAWSDDMLLFGRLRFLEKAKTLTFSKEKDGTLSVSECYDGTKPDLDGCRSDGNWFKLKSQGTLLQIIIINSVST